MRSCLTGVTIPEWLGLLNSKVFFFLNRDKALALAQVYAAYRNLLLETDTATLLERYAPHITLCRINSGSFLYTPRPRGRDSFIPLANYRYAKKRDTPAELSVNVPIPDILSFSTLNDLQASPALLPA